MRQLNILVCVLLVHQACGQYYPNCSAFGTENTTVLSDLVSTPDDGVLCVGWTHSGIGTLNDLLLVRLDAEGDTLWTRVFIGPGHDQGIAMILRNDSTAIVCGRTSSVGIGLFDFDMWVFAVDLDGALLWSTVVRSAEGGPDEALALAPTADGGCLVTGEIYGNQGRLALVKLDMQGDVEWSHGLNANLTRGNALIALSDGGFAVAGTRTVVPTASNQLVLRLDADGAPLWQRVLVGPYGDQATCVAEHADLGLLVGGSTGPGGEPMDLTLTALDQTGTLLWGTRVVGAGADHAARIEPRGNGTWSVSGFSSSFGTGGTLLLEVADVVQSTRLYTTPVGEGLFRSMAVAADGGLWGCGNTTEAGLTQGWVIRLDPQLEPCPACASWELVSSTGGPLTIADVNYAFIPMGTDTTFIPTVGSLGWWEQGCLTTQVSASPFEEQVVSWIAPGHNALHITPPKGWAGSYTWSIVEVAGRELAAGQASGGVQLFDTGFQGRGVHLLLIQSVHGPRHVERFFRP